MSDLDAPKEQADEVEDTRDKRTPRSPSEYLEAKTLETKRMATAGASRAETNSSTALSWHGHGLSKIATVGIRCGNLCSSGDQA